MAPPYFFVFFLLSHLVLLHSAQEEKCPPFYCGNPKEIHFQYSAKPSECGWVTVDNCIEAVPKIQLDRGGEKWFDVVGISLADTIAIHDPPFLEHLQDCQCQSSENWTLPSSPSISFKFTTDKALSRCNHDLSTTPHKYFSYIGCHFCDFYHLPTLPPQCSSIHPPINMNYTNNDHLLSLLAADIFLEVQVSEHCRKCYYKGRECKSDDNGKFQYANTGTNKRLGLKLGLSLGIGCPAILIIFFVLFILWRRYKRKHTSSDFLSRNISSYPSSMSYLERGGVYFRVPIFSYSELEEATNNFDPTKELGDGGFGIVYHGKLQDGREVAVKRLYEKNYKQVEQFINEIEILTHLRHKNLVSLYGCTSRHSRELLLVYEFIPNGTVADHLHGDRAKPLSLTWPIRMSIAIETAEALTYLHASDIIHRDVKTNNILLDNNFCVKVADFGLSSSPPMSPMSQPLHKGLLVM